jgi:hypothetical protein
LRLSGIMADTTLNLPKGLWLVKESGQIGPKRPHAGVPWAIRGQIVPITLISVTEIRRTILPTAIYLQAGTKNGPGIIQHHRGRFLMGLSIQRVSPAESLQVLSPRRTFLTPSSRRTPPSLSSFPRKRESILDTGRWIPVCAGMTNLEMAAITILTIARGERLPHFRHSRGSGNPSWTPEGGSPPARG